MIDGEGLVSVFCQVVSVGELWSAQGKRKGSGVDCDEDDRNGLLSTQSTPDPVTIGTETRRRLVRHITHCKFTEKPDEILTGFIKFAVSGKKRDGSFVSDF